MERAIQPEIPSPRCRADECMREHRETITGTRRNPQSAVQVAVPVGTTGCSSRTGLVDRELPRIHSSPRGQQAKAVTGRQNGRGGFFQRCLAKNRGSTPAQQRLWRDGIYDQIREVMSLQGSLSIERMCQMVPVSRRGFYRSLNNNSPATGHHKISNVTSASRQEIKH